MVRSEAPFQLDARVEVVELKFLLNFRHAELHDYGGPKTESRQCYFKKLPIFA